MYFDEIIVTYIAQVSVTAKPSRAMRVFEERKRGSAVRCND